MELAFLLVLIVNQLGNTFFNLELAVFFFKWGKSNFFFLQARFSPSVSRLIVFSMDVSDILTCQGKVLLSFILEQPKLIFNN